MEATRILCLEVEVLDSFVHLEPFLFVLFCFFVFFFGRFGVCLSVALLWLEGRGMERSEVGCVNSVCSEPCVLCTSECDGRLMSTACPQTWNVEQCTSGRMGAVQIWL